MADRIAKIWSSPGMKKTFECRRNQHVMDNTPHFLDKIEQLYVHGEDDQSNTIHRKDMQYTPTWEDYLRIRDQTTGVLTYNFASQYHHKEWNFRLTDVGGQRSERKKWINVFHSVGVVIYVTSLNGYDQSLFEATTVKCYDESFDVFSELAKNRVFQHTDFIVFLNKLDLFEEKLKSVPFTTYDESFEETSKHDKDKVLAYVRGKFEKLWFQENYEESQVQRGLFFQLTCSLDTTTMRTVIGQVNMALVTRAMRNSAMM